MSKIGQEAQQLGGQSSSEEYECIYSEQENSKNVPNASVVKINPIKNIESQASQIQNKENQPYLENFTNEGNHGYNHTISSQSEKLGSFEGSINLPNTSPIKNNQMDIEHQGNQIQNLQNGQLNQGNQYQSHTSSSQSQSQSDDFSHNKKMADTYLNAHVNPPNNYNKNLDFESNNTSNQPNQTYQPYQENSIKEGKHGQNHMSSSQSEKLGVFEGTKNLPNTSQIKNNQMDIEHQGNQIQNLQNGQLNQGNQYQSHTSSSQSQSQPDDFSHNKKMADTYLNAHVHPPNNYNEKFDLQSNNTYNQPNQTNLASSTSSCINQPQPQQKETKITEVFPKTIEPQQLYQIIHQYQDNNHTKGQTLSGGISDSKMKNNVSHQEEEKDKQQSKDKCQLIYPDEQQNNQLNLNGQNTILDYQKKVNKGYFSSNPYGNIIKSINTDQYPPNQTSQLPLIDSEEVKKFVAEKFNNQTSSYYADFKKITTHSLNNNKHQEVKELQPKINEIVNEDPSLLGNVNLTIRIKQLVMKYPLRQFSISIKQDIYTELINSLSQQDWEQELHITRCTENTKLPQKINYWDLLKTQLIQCEDTFSYFKPDINENHWYLNFADCSLFGFYTSALYAQDELQCTEMPMLAHIKEYLEKQTEQPRLKPRTQSNDQPTPILIQNVPRIGTIDIKPCKKYRRGLYGNNFRQLQKGDLQEKLTVFKGADLVYTNIIAMSAIGYGHGIYKESQIKFTLLTAYKAFKQAVKSTQEYAKGKKCVIHTGNWGCGAFGNNYQLMAILQLLAANLAGVDILYYHTFNQHGTNQFFFGKNTYERIVYDSQNQIDGGAVQLMQIINLILQQKFEWGQSDGN